MSDPIDAFIKDLQAVLLKHECELSACNDSKGKPTIAVWANFVGGIETEFSWIDGQLKVDL